MLGDLGLARARFWFRTSPLLSATTLGNSRRGEPLSKGVEVVGLEVVNSVEVRCPGAGASLFSYTRLRGQTLAACVCASAFHWQFSCSGMELVML